MFKPLGEIMIIEECKTTGIVLPDNKDTTNGSLFIVKEVGPGLMLDCGQVYKPDVIPGDKVAISGKMLTIPDGRGNDILVARMTDVLLVEREDPIPEKI